MGKNLRYNYTLLYIIITYLCIDNTVASTRLSIDNTLHGSGRAVEKSGILL